VIPQAGGWLSLCAMALERDELFPTSSDTVLMIKQTVSGLTYIQPGEPGLRLDPHRFHSSI
jgi:hypothetical protein